MATVASPKQFAGVRSKSGAWLRAARTPILVAAVGTLLTFIAGFVTQTLTQNSQDHQKRLELKTALASEMSKSYTTAIGIARSIGTGTVFSATGEPVTPDEVAATYNRGLGNWQIGSAGVTAEFAARFAGKRLVEGWRDYAAAVTYLFRVAAVQPPGPERGLVVKGLHEYVNDQQALVQPRLPSSTWQVLTDTPRRFSKSPPFPTIFRTLCDWMLKRGDQLMEEMLTLGPSV